MNKVDFFLIFVLCALVAIFIYLKFISEYFQKPENFANKVVDFGNVKGKLAAAANGNVNSLYNQIMKTQVSL